MHLAVPENTPRSIAQLLPMALLAALCGALLGCSPSYDFAAPPNMARAEALRNVMESGAAAASTDSGSAAAATAEPTGWATLKGQFLLAGSPPEMPRLPVSGGDVEVCAPGNKPVYSEEFVSGPNGGIKNVLIYLARKIDGEEPWTHPSMKPGTEGEFVFDQKNCVFLTHVFAMQTGHTLRILNSDPIGHNTNIAQTPVNRIVAAGGEITYQPDEEWKSPVKVTCSIHPWMSAHMLVRDNGYFAVTDEEGRFEIPNLPAGVELEFRVWQEKAGPLSGIEIDGQTVKKGKWVVTLPEEGIEFATSVEASLFQ